MYAVPPLSLNAKGCPVTELSETSKIYVAPLSKVRVGLLEPSITNTPPATVTTKVVSKLNAPASWLTLVISPATVLILELFEFTAFIFVSLFATEVTLLAIPATVVTLDDIPATVLILVIALPTVFTFVIEPATVSISGCASCKSAATVSISVSVDNGSNYYHLAKTVAVPADATLVVIDKNSQIYLDETDLLRIVGSANNDLEYVVSGEILDDE